MSWDEGGVENVIVKVGWQKRQAMTYAREPHSGREIDDSTEAHKTSPYHHDHSYIQPKIIITLQTVVITERWPEDGVFQH